MRWLFPLIAGVVLAASPAHAQAQKSRAKPAAEAKVKADDKTSVAREIRKQAKGRIDDFYAERGFWPIWVTEGEINAAGPRFLALVESAEVDGLDPGDYNPDELREAMIQANSGLPGDLARAELKLSREFARYVRDMRKPRTSMQYLDPEVEPVEPREDVVLRRAALAGSMPEYVGNMGWMHPLYAGLRRNLERSLGPVDPLPQIVIPSGPLLKLGSKGERVRLLRERLGLVPGVEFDEELGEAVAAFQEGQGLQGDQVVGSKTIAALNNEFEIIPVTNLAALRLNLERARLLPDPWTRHVVVNAASARLAYYDQGQEQGEMKVVVGTPETPTPMMAGMIRYATLNPYWNIPIDLVQNRIAPKVMAGSSLTSLGYEALSDWTADAEVIDDSSVDWAAVKAGEVQLRVRELPGKGNAMGNVKFMFPNNLGIYLHDTPNKRLFKEKARQFSNGCVRLEDAARLGKWFFGEALMTDADTPEQHRPLPKAVPVFLTYLTAVPEGRSIAYLDDVYSRDGREEMKLATMN